MSRVTQQPDSRGRAPPPQLQRKHQVRQLGLTVGLPWRVCCFPLQVIEIDPLHAHVCGSARNSCNSRGLRALECWHQQGCQRERPQEVGPELQLEAIGRQLALRHRHYSCVVYEEIQLRLTIDPLGKCPHRSQICQSSVSKCTLADGSSRRIRSTASRSFASDRAARITSL